MRLAVATPSPDFRIGVVRGTAAVWPTLLRWINPTGPPDSKIIVPIPDRPFRLLSGTDPTQAGEAGMRQLLRQLGRSWAAFPRGVRICAPMFAGVPKVALTCCLTCQRTV